MVGGPGFEPGASRSRIERRSVLTYRFALFGCRIIESLRRQEHTGDQRRSSRGYSSPNRSLIRLVAAASISLP